MSKHKLPAPNQIAKRHSDQLCSKIRSEIMSRGPISFARYMELALYAPGLGYYSAGAQKFGEAGDFITAPEISPLFSRCLAQQCAQVLSDMGGGVIIEFGAGTGIMALELLKALKKKNQLPESYLIVEVSADLRDRQQTLFQQQAPELLPLVKWHNTLPSEKITGVILGNEVIDAMPVHKFKNQQGIKEYYVDDQGNHFVWQMGDPSTPKLTEAVKLLAVDLPDDYESEINLWLLPWISSVSDILLAGIVLLIDYGFPRSEYYHPQRSMGTVMCHYRHYAHHDPFLYPGLQDITAHVDFTAVANAALANGLDVLGYTHQAAFLLGCEIDTLLLDPSDVKNYYQQAQAVKRLTLPSEMGELFKVIALGRRCHTPLMGFSLFNQREKL